MRLSLILTLALFSACRSEKKQEPVPARSAAPKPVPSASASAASKIDGNDVNFFTQVSLARLTPEDRAR